MADQVLRSLPAVTPAPADFVVPNAAEWVLQVVSASFDGTGAAGAFLPAVQIIGPGGDVAATFADKNVSVAAGSSCEVTFGPFLRSPSASSAGGTGLKNDTSPQTGGWFIDTLNGPGGGPNGFAFEIDDAVANGIFLNSDTVVSGSNNPGNAQITVQGANIRQTLNSAAARWQVRAPTNIIDVEDNMMLGFFGVTPVVQQATPVTLANVIALLQAYGFCP